MGSSFCRRAAEREIVGSGWSAIAALVVPLNNGRICAWSTVFVEK
jgi:hypothetical protein